MTGETSVVLQRHRPRRTQYWLINIVELAHALGAKPVKLIEPMRPSLISRMKVNRARRLRDERVEHRSRVLNEFHKPWTLCDSSSASVAASCIRTAACAQLHAHSCMRAAACAQLAHLRAHSCMRTAACAQLHARSCMRAARSTPKMPSRPG